MRRLIDLGDGAGAKVMTERTGRKLWDAGKEAAQEGDLDDFGVRMTLLKRRWSCETGPGSSSTPRQVS